MNGEPHSSTPAAPLSLEEVVGGIVEHLLATADYDRADRLWPSSFQVYGTNPLSVAYGACGTALFLHRQLGELPPRVRQWLLDRPLSVDDYPPGLFVGLAGVAWSFFELGLHDRADEAMRLACNSPLRFHDPSMFQGTAGWGLASLYFHGRTGQAEWLDRAVEAGDHLLATAQREGDTCCWQADGDNRVSLGYGYGASGIALFLLYLGLRTGNEAYLDHARRGVEYDIANRMETSVGWQWGRHADDAVVYPYYLLGSAGVGNTVIRMLRHLGGERWHSLARELTEAVAMKWAALPGLLEGMAGLGEFLVDMHLVTGDREGLEHAYELAESITWYAVEREKGIAFPGRFLGQISSDYAMGSAGIGFFLARLSSRGPRLFMDL